MGTLQFNMDSCKFNSKENVEKWYNNNAMCEMMMKRMIYITGVVDSPVRIEYSSIQHG